MDQTLYVIIYGNNILADVDKIVNCNYSLNTSSSFENIHMFIDENKNWAYYLVQKEYDNKTTKILEKILKEHYEKEYLITFYDDEKSEMKVKKKIILER